MSIRRPGEPAWFSWAHEIGAWILSLAVVAAVAIGIVWVWP